MDRASLTGTTAWRLQHVFLAVILGFVAGFSYENAFNFRSRLAGEDSAADGDTLVTSISRGNKGNFDSSSPRSDSFGNNNGKNEGGAALVYEHDFPSSPSSSSGPIISKFSCVNSYGTACTLLASSPFSSGRRLKATTFEASAEDESTPIECRESSDGNPSCVLENVCIRSSKILYYLPRTMSTRLLPPETIPIGFYGPKLKVEVRDSNEADQHTFIDRVVGLIGRYYPLNVGHAIADEIIACFMLFLKFGIQWNTTPPPLIGTTTEPELWGPYELLTDVEKNVVSFSSLAGKCYTKVAVGIVDTGYAMGMRGTSGDRASVLSRDSGFQRGSYQLRLFTQHAMARMGVFPVAGASPLTALSPRPLSSDNLPPFTVLFVEKDLSVAQHKDRWINLDDIVGRVAKSFPSFSVSKVKWYGMPLRDQVALMRTVDVMITLPGSDAMNAMFMRDGSTLIMPCRTVRGVAESSHEFELMMRYTPWVKTIEFCAGGFTELLAGWKTNVFPGIILSMLKTIHMEWADRRAGYLQGALGRRASELLRGEEYSLKGREDDGDDVGVGGDT